MDTSSKLKELEAYFGIKTRNWLLRELIESDSEGRSQFEYSIKIKNGKLQNKLRIINYMNNFKNEKEYRRRIGLFCKKHANQLIQNILLRTRKHNLPVYYATEQDNESTKYKVYVNFYSIKDMETLINTAKSIFGSSIAFRNHYFPLIGLDLNERFLATSYKVYYVYPFSSNEKSIDPEFIENIKEFSSEDFFVISERYNQKNEILSKKCEINLGINYDATQIILRLGFSKEMVNKLMEINSLVDGKLKVVIKEKGDYALYFRF